MARRESKYTHCYMDYKDHQEVRYVRLGMVETPRFPHGLALATTFSKKEDAEKFADDVDAYIKTMLGKK